MRRSTCRFSVWLIMLAIAGIALWPCSSVWATDASVHILSPGSGATVSGIVAVQTSLGPDSWWARLKVDGNIVAATPPATFSWNSTTVPNGTHTLQVDSFLENGSAPVASNSISVTVNNDASVNILSPANGATVSGTVAVEALLGPASWWAQLKVDGDIVAATPPATFSWNSTTVPNGTHTLQVDSFLENGSAPVASNSISVTVNNVSNPPPIYFSTLPPGATLPSGAWCADNIPVTGETIPVNAVPNAQVPSSSQLASFYTASSGAAVPAQYLDNVDGNYTGSTDMILRWAACKWGIDENLVRAQAWGESAGIQAGLQGVGDWTSDQALCPPGSGFPGAWDGTSCGQSYGIMQIKYPYQTFTWPMSQTSTAFNVDYRFAVQRACMNGDIAYLAERTPVTGYPTYPNGDTDQMLWGCIGQWYSGGWYDNGALGYIDWITLQLSEQLWLQ